MTTSGRSYGAPEMRTVFVYKQLAGIYVLFQSKNTMKIFKAGKQLFWHLFRGLQQKGIVYGTPFSSRQSLGCMLRSQKLFIFLTSLQCYSLWRTLFELNHHECRVDFSNWHEHSRLTFKMPAPRLLYTCSNTMIKYKRFWGDRQSVCHPGWPVYRPGYQGTVVRETCPR